ncbi:hypothetical protein BCR32DRAFT_290601 [Anaeromyces robustus]|uniref:Uncharacterized protein n=1 Tax=Anaeromyces robustus TaxID=1754192 RepID=A0A1Y1XIM9_9FUNG|nr:hypothetical protein BCR32DRAFT_290601 [Anaeromyces robustus]|eukprot:ORX85617.1 hypothetical protein BCR32DRAFT_290601 [Anaeromyces robustus]
MKMNSIRQEKKINDVTNRTTIKKKVISPEEMYRNRRKVVLPSDKDPEFTYGIPTRPPSPFHKVISYHYYREFERKQEENQKQELLQKKKLRHEHFERMAAPANLLSNLVANRVQKTEEDPRKLFKMKKFSKAQPKIDSWWTLPPGASTIQALDDNNAHDPSTHHSSPPPEKIENNHSTEKEITEEENCQYTQEAVQESVHEQEIPEEHHVHYSQEIPEEVHEHEEHYHYCHEVPEEYSYEYEQEIPEDEYE